MKSIRTFFALELPAPFRHTLSKVLLQLKTSCPPVVRWIPVENIHLTLIFHGDTPTDRIKDYSRVCLDAIPAVKPLSVHAVRLGAFPNLHQPRVIWAGIEAPEYLFTLQKFLDTASRKLGYPGEERSFSPHLTLGRVNEKADTNDRSMIETALRNFQGLDHGPYVINTLHLFRSTLMPSGAVYTSLSSLKLGEISTQSGGDS